MSDIRKNLTLSAQLDDSQLRKQLDILKKEMGKSFSVDAGSLNDLKASIKDIAKEFGSQLRKELEGIRGAKGKAVIANAPKDGTVNSSEIGSFQIKQMQVTNMVVNTMTVKGGGSYGPGGGGGEGGAEGSGNPKARWFDNIPGAKGLHKRFGMAGVASAGMTFAGMGIERVNDEILEMRKAMNHRRQAETLDITHGRGLEGALRQSGRGLNLTSGLGAAGGALKYAGMGAGAGALLGGVPGALIGGTIGGIYGGVKGFFSGGEKEAERRAQKGRPALEALEYARSLRQGRVSAMTGGGISGSQLSLLQQRGAQNYGFNPEETVNQYNSAKQSLGSRGARANLATLQELQRSVGVDVNESARSSEIFAGGGRTTMSGGVQKMVDTLKKGVASGLDASKSGQFLKSASEYIQQSAGLGAIDVDKITEQLSRSVFGYARGGEATQMDIERAVTTQQQKRQESTASGGISGIGNINAIQSSMPNASSSQFMAAQNISSNATVEDVQRILGVDKDTAQKFLDAKGNNLKSGLETVAPGDQALQLALGSKETGQSTEQFYGRTMAEQVQGPMQAGALPAVQSSTDLDSLIKEATVKQTQFVSGIDLMARESQHVAEQLKTVASTIEKAASYIKEIVGPGAVQVKR